MPTFVTRSTSRLRALAVAQALVLLVALGVPITALASVDSVSPSSLAQGATHQLVTITGSDFERRCRTYEVTFSGSGVTATDVERISRTVMTAYVTVAATAPLGPRDVTVSGSGHCDGFRFTGIGKLTITAGGAVATKLAVVSISPASPTVGAPFGVLVQAQDAAGNPAGVTTATGVALALNTGTGTLGGTLTGVIANGASSITISGVTYSKAESGVRLTVTRTSGMALAPGTSAPFTVVGFAKLQLLVPGERAAPGTPSGKTGTPTAQTAGTPFTVTVNAVDASWNVVSSTHTVAITSSDANATLPANAALVAGTKAFSVTLKTAGSRTVTASDVTDGTKAAGTSPPITVNPGSFAKLQLLVPGETAAPGTATGKTGTPTTQAAGVPFTVTVNAVDAYWNVATSNHVVRITSSDPAATLPANAALAAGTRTFGVTLNTAGSRAVTATDVTDGSKTASTSPPISVVAPTAISLVRSRGMIAYGESVTFFVQLVTGGAGRPIVLEYTSVGVPWTPIASLVTNAAGAAAFTYAPARTGYVRARFAGAPDLGAATSPILIVGVRQIVTLDPSHAGVMTIARGRSITFRSTVSPLRADLLPSIVTFRFYRNVGGAWVLRYQRNALTDTSGVARTTFTFGQAGSWYVRAFAPRTPYNSISRYTQREFFRVR
jgi:hypothetical protein